MRFEPIRTGFRRGFLQEIDDLSALQIHEDRRIDPTLPLGPLVDAHDPRRRILRAAPVLPDQAEEAVGGRRCSLRE